MEFIINTSIFDLIFFYGFCVDVRINSFYRLWIFGLVLVIVGSLGDFAALSMAAQSIVAPVTKIDRHNTIKQLQMKTQNIKNKYNSNNKAQNMT